MSSQRFPYTPHPQFPVGIPFVNRLGHSTKNMALPAVVDSGAALNVLPHDMGLSLGLDWEEQTYPLDMGGMLASTQAFAVLLEAEIEAFPPFQLGFAWINKPSTEIRVLLGQVNFFQEFDVHFYGHQKLFEITLRTK